MTKEEIITELEETQCDVRLHRDRITRLIGACEAHVPILLDISFESDDSITFRGARILEFICKKNLDSIAPHLNQFTQNIAKVNHHSTKRVIAKICELIAYAYIQKETNLVQEVLSKKQKERIITACLDWMIQPEKMAVHAYAMQTLYLLGERWVHEELKQILLENMIHGSPGYLVRAKKILNAIR